MKPGQASRVPTQVVCRMTGRTGGFVRKRGYSLDSAVHRNTVTLCLAMDTTKLTWDSLMLLDTKGNLGIEASLKWMAC
jgi:hypothetical protein